MASYSRGLNLGRLRCLFAKDFWYRVYKCVWVAICNLVQHDGVELSGYVAFLMMIGIFPFLFLLVSLTNILGIIDANSQVVLVTSLLDDQEWSYMIEALKPRIVEIVKAPPHGLLTLATISAIWTASSTLEALRNLFNRAYQVTSPLDYILGRMLSIAVFMILTICVGLVIAVITVVPLMATFLSKYFVLSLSSQYLWIMHNASLRYVFAIVLEFYLIASLYYFLVHAKQKFSQTFPGTILTIVGWYVSSSILQYYVMYFPQINLIYGSIAGIIIALLYFHVCSMIFVYGAEFNYCCVVYFFNNEGISVKKRRFD